MAIAFLGPRGTNSEEAAIVYGGADADMIAFSSIPALTEAVETGIADAAVLPIENSIEGGVSTTLDLLIHETGLKIYRELVVPIRHMLISQKTASLGDIGTVVSHPQALAQCRRFLERCLPNAEQVAALSTAGAVKAMVDGDDRTVAAIGPAASQSLYGGAILAHDIQDIRTNLTRFIVLRNEDAEPTGDDKTSIGLTAKADEPGVLEHIIRPIAEARLQLTRLETRPTKGWLGTYVFLIDLEGHHADPKVADVLARVEQRTTMMRVFGSYPRFPIEDLRDLVKSPALL
jgi:prephenate dehydratase